MAQINKRLPENVEGEFYVDSSCIDCDTCRAIAPDTFRDHGSQSSVYRQPQGDRERLLANMALIACPTASIGSTHHLNAREAVDAFPSQVTENIFFCGYTSESSFGGWSYLVVRPPQEGGNLLVDSPRFTAPLVRRIEQMGGIETMFLSHRDDIADHAKFAAEFHCRRIMHAREGAAGLQVEQVIEGDDPVVLGPDLLAIPTPGHTRGHMVLLYRNQFLFTGDHLAWSPEAHTLKAHRNACWYSWPEQTRSMERLLDYRFGWVLPGHGRIGHDDPQRMHEHLR
ncbi:MAG: MBL fold metallo-hydrolase, partial [Acidobacteriales bacterium]|nr:MBL fold metallo-hydrolase [Terriglobales bacterium]